MTAVAPPLSFQPMSRNGWPTANGTSNGLNNAMMGEDVSRMLMPRKGTQRTNSSSSLSSNGSSTSTASAGPVIQNGTNGPVANSEWASRKRSTRSLWPPSKTEPVSGLSTARPQSITSANTNASAASGLSALQAPQGSALAQNGINSQIQTNGLPRGPQITADTPVLFLAPMNGTFERKTIAVPFFPDTLRIGRQTNGKTLPTAHNGYFDSKVLSRQHAEIWANRQGGQIFIRDVKSSNGTFVNGQRLSQENKDSEPHELREQDLVELGIDIVSEDQKTVVHHKVAARVEVAGFYGAGNNNILDMNFGDFDAAGPGGMLGQSLGHAGAMRRTNSQGSMGSIRGAPSLAGSSIAAMPQQRQNHFWLTPVNMDQIVKKLNAEYKAAKQQSADLQRAAQYIDNLLTQPVKKEPSPEKVKTVPSMKDSFKARFSDPPAPPPAAPLPEKPDVPSLSGSTRDASMHHFLRRSDTAKAKVPGISTSPMRELQGESSNATQIASLSEALESVRKEFEDQSLRLKEMENLLSQERSRREDAEERAKKLESSRPAESYPSPTKDKSAEDALTEIPDDVASLSDDLKADTNTSAPSSETAQIQQRLDQLILEFNEVKLAAERWRVEKEKAEQERDEERSERQSLAAMVEKLRAEEAERITKQARNQERRKRRTLTPQSAKLEEHTRSAAALEDEDASSGDDTEGELDVTHDESNEKSHKQANGFANGILDVKNSSLATSLPDALALAKRPTAFVQAAPFMSAMSVVFIGVAIMALVNKMQKGEK